MNIGPAELTRVSTAQLDSLVGFPGQYGPELVAELSSMWGALKHDLVREWPASEGLEARVLRQVLHRHRGVVASWGLAGLEAGMLAAEKAEDPVAAWRELGPRMAAVLPAVFAVVEARHPELRGDRKF